MTERKATKLMVGWWKPASSRSWHFFGADARSFCGKWMHMGAELQTGNDDSPDNCAACKKKLAQLFHDKPDK